MSIPASRLQPIPKNHWTPKHRIASLMSHHLLGKMWVPRGHMPLDLPKFSMPPMILEFLALASLDLPGSMIGTVRIAPAMAKVTLQEVSSRESLRG